MYNTEAINELVDLFAVIAKQDKWNHNLNKEYLNFFFRHYNDAELSDHLSSKYDEHLKGISLNEVKVQHQLGMDLDSVKTLAITKRINKLLSDEERLMVLALLCEQAKTGDFMTTQRNEIIEAINSVFALDKTIFSAIKNFVLNENAYAEADENTVILEATELSLYNRIRGVKHEKVATLDKPVAIKKINAYPQLLLIKYSGEKNIAINGVTVEPKRLYILRSTDKLTGDGFAYSFEQLNSILEKKFTLESLHIPKADKMPLIDFNVETNVLKISGVSIPEDALAFYKPILHWLGLYLQVKPTKATLIFELEFFNTVSSRLFLEIMKFMQKLKESGADVTIQWLYDEDDEDIKEAGENYAEMVEVNFLIEPR
jgi:hypothetical protein